MSARRGVGWPRCGEIDLAEVIGRQPSIAHLRLHGPGYSGGAALSADYDLHASLSRDYHTYAATRTPDRVTFSIDGRQVRTFTKAEVERRDGWVFGQPFFLLLNVAIGGWAGQPTSTTTWPQTMVVDYVRVTTP